MRIVLDACVIFPTVMREILVGCAQADVFSPVWSPRIIEEWLRATEKLGPDARPIAVAEAAVMADQFPDASVAVDVRDDIWLPDPNDEHVLATAIAADATGIMTVNTRDFPLRALRQFNVERFHPDAFLLTVAQRSPVVSRVVADVRKRAENLSGRDQPTRALLKRTGLPRLGKFLD